MHRRDDVDLLYKQSKVLADVAQLCFWLNICAAIAMIVVPSLEKIWVAIQALMTVLFLITSVIDDCYCWYEAESTRRVANLSDALGINLTDFHTEGYYNNDIPPSLMRYAVNSFESIFFTKAIVQKTLLHSLLKSCLAILTMIIILYVGSNNVLLITLQAVLSGYVLQGAIMLIAFYIRIRNLYNELYHGLITTQVMHRDQAFLVYSLAAEFEACKAYFKIRLSSKRFVEMNEDLSQKWTELKASIRISKSMMTPK